VSKALAFAFAFFVLMLASNLQAQAPTDIRSAIRAGMVGERFDGYMGYAADPGDAIKRQVSAVNIRRRALYLQLATRRNVSARYAAVAAGCELMSSIKVGQAYMLADGVWRIRQPGQAAPVPDYCSTTSQ